ncbi:MAG: proline dehydrogenase family protein [Candidatus Diapherotrites archaeon]|nr:proline dehydrogenase family protein [Candidatus Diapherotrites archaeon]MDZ4256101.1 proline dehydrogenase family protein [archaeon]
MRWYKPLLFPFASRFIAGETLHEALVYGQRRRKEGITPLFDVLGEAATRKSEIVRATNDYMNVIEGMHDAKIQGGLSLKLTSFGLDEDKELCFRAVHRIVRHAHAHRILVWVDMESSAHTKATLSIYRRLLEHHDNVGICIQAYLKRSKRDILSLLPDNPKIRLVKGAYTESASVAYTRHPEVVNHFKALITLCIEKKVWLAVATHDMTIINHTLSLAGKTKNHLEFQMLKGIKDREKKVLSEAGYRVAEYIPFGKEWDRYFFRRLREGWYSLLWMLVSSLTG